MLTKTGTPSWMLSPLCRGGFFFLGILLCFVVLSSIILIPLRHRVRRPVSAVAVILQTPFNFQRVVPSSSTVVEIPSFYRGLVSLWVTAGVILVTAYQSEVYVTQNVATLSSVQPGSTFTSKLSTSTASASVSLTMVPYQTPIFCDPSEFTLQVIAANSASTGSLSGTPNCVEDALLPSVNISFSFPAALSFTSTSSVSLVVTSLSGSPEFTHGVSYQLLLGNYGGTFIQMTPTTPATNSLAMCPSLTLPYRPST